MMKEGAKGSMYWDMHGDFFRLMQKFINGDEAGSYLADAYLQNVVDETESFYQKYHCKYAKDLALALVGELERRSKAEQNMKKHMQIA